MPPRKPCPKGRGQCRTCWNHAYDRQVHRRLKPGQDCPTCIDHLNNGHPPSDIEP
jgi:hypothetical protein